MSPKLIRRLLLLPIWLLLAFELICWAFRAFPEFPERTLSLTNTIPGFKKDVKLTFDRDFVRYSGWTGGEKPAGTVRVFCLGGWATQGILQNVEDTWWGRLKARLDQQGINTQFAAWGDERVGILRACARMTPVIERLKPDVIIANFGFDDIIVHPVEYRYQPDKLATLQPPVESSFKRAVFKVSQLARFRRWMKVNDETGTAQNDRGRTDAYKKFFTERKNIITGTVPYMLSPPVREASRDPLPEYLDGLAALRDVAARNHAALILTGEASLDDVVNHIRGEDAHLIAYILKDKSKEEGGSGEAERPQPGWVMNEMMRYAAAAAKFASDNKLPWVDLNGSVPRDTDHFFTDVMLTDRGAEEAAKLLEPVVLPVVKEKAGR